MSKFFVILKLMLYEHVGRKYVWFTAEVGASRLRIWKFLKTEQEKFVLISIILCADSVATYASLDQILCLRNMIMVRNLQYYKKSVLDET